MAKAALCSDEQGRFSEADAFLHTHPITTQTELPAFAKSLQLNLKKLQTCMASPKTAEQLALSTNRVAAASITRLPGFELGSNHWIGVLTREELQRNIENAR